MGSRRGVTLIEILVVVIIIGIVAAIGLPNFQKTKERALGREAQANLKLIAAAEKIYRLEDGDDYYPTTPGTVDDITTINAELKLSLNENNWDYSITTGTDADSFTAYADRSSTGCQYTIDEDDDGPTPNSSCP